MQHSSGTTDAAEFARRNGMLTRLARTANTDTLRAFARGEISIDELVRFDGEENLKRGLDALRAARASATAGVCTSALPAVVPIEVSSSDIGLVESELPSMSPPASTPVVTVERPANAASNLSWVGALQWPGIELNADFAVPLWSTCQERMIPGMLHLDEATRRRYDTFIRALSQKLAVCRATDAQFEVLAGIAPAHWDLLGKARMRLTTVALRDAVRRSANQQRVLLSTLNVRLHVDVHVHVDVLQQLGDVTEAEWDVLVALAPFPVTHVMVEALDHASPNERAALRSLANTRGPNATILSLGTVTNTEWHVLSRFWGRLRHRLESCASGRERVPFSVHRNGPFSVPAPRHRPHAPAHRARAGTGHHAGKAGGDRRAPPGIGPEFRLVLGALRLPDRRVSAAHACAPQAANLWHRRARHEDEWIASPDLHRPVRVGHR